MELKFYRCKVCGKIIAIVKDTGVPTICCGEEMEQIIPGTTDAAVEKHVPVITVNGNTVEVKVGSVEHPMLPEHYIEWIALVGNNQVYKRDLTPQDKPEAVFPYIKGAKLYSYCNNHALWVKEVE